MRCDALVGPGVVYSVAQLSKRAASWSLPLGSASISHDRASLYSLVSDLTELGRCQLLGPSRLVIVQLRIEPFDGGALAHKDVL